MLDFEGSFKGMFRKDQDCSAGKETPKKSEGMRQEGKGLNKTDGCTHPPHLEKISATGAAYERQPPTPRLQRKTVQKRPARNTTMRSENLKCSEK